MAIAIFVNKLIKMVHFTIYRKEIDALEYAKIFVEIVFILYGVLEVIIFDCDPYFTGKFWVALFDLLNTNLWFNIAYYS